MVLHRSSWKVPYVDVKSKIFFYKQAHLDVHRSAVIPVGLTDHKVKVYNGKNFVFLEITPKHIGFRFGDFSFSKIYRLKKNPDIKAKFKKKKKLK